MKKHKTSLFATLALVPAFWASAAMADPYNFDIAGLKLGETFDEATYQKSLSEINGNFQLQRVVSEQKEVVGLVAQEKFADSKLAYQLGSKHRDRLFLYSGDDGRLEQMTRLQVLPPSDQITLGQLRGALIEKYGEPTEEGGFDVMAARWYGASWVFTPDGRKLDKTADADLVRECRRTYISPKPSATQIQYVTAHGSCGFILQASYKDVERGYFDGAMPDESILQYYMISMFDSKSAYEAIQRKKSEAASAQEAAHQDRLKRAQSNKPKL